MSFSLVIYGSFEDLQSEIVSLLVQMSKATAEEWTQHQEVIQKMVRDWKSYSDQLSQKEQQIHQKLTSLLTSEEQEQEKEKKKKDEKDKENEKEKKIDFQIPNYTLLSVSERVEALAQKLDDQLIQIHKMRSFVLPFAEFLEEYPSNLKCMLPCWQKFLRELQDLVEANQSLFWFLMTWLFLVKIFILVFFVIFVWVFLCYANANPEQNVLRMKAHHSRAGFFSLLHHYLWAAHEAETQNKQLIADWSSCPYVDPDVKEKNSFNYYFTCPSPSSSSTVTTITDYTDFPSHQQQIPPSLKYLWQKYVLYRLQPSIQKEWKKLRSKWFSSKKEITRIGIHGRFTDKFNGPSSFEHNHQHPTYESVYSIMKTYIQQNGIFPYRIYIASDEQPFVDFLMKQKWPRYKKEANRQVLFCLSDAYRSEKSTSGLTLNVSDCDTRPNDADCKLYWSLPKESVHLGHPEWSNQKKGRDVLLDGLLLSESQIFFKSRGNISNIIEALVLQQNRIVVDTCTTT